MLQKSINIYQNARESTGLTQETVAELLNISVESVRAYEGGKRIPPDKVVTGMVEIFDNKLLAYLHLKTSTQLGAKFLPNVTKKNLAEAILALYKSVNDFVVKRDRLIEIGCDGIIDPTEMPEFKSILQELDSIIEAVMSLKAVVHEC